MDEARTAMGWLTKLALRQAARIFRLSLSCFGPVFLCLFLYKALMTALL